MGITIDLAEESQLQLDAADITVHEDTIQFSVEGEIQQIPNGVLAQFNGQPLLPSEITFEQG